eukprot:4059150-Prymnesium_polylepis.1
MLPGEYHPRNPRNVPISSVYRYSSSCKYSCKAVRVWSSFRTSRCVISAVRGLAPRNFEPNVVAIHTSSADRPGRRGGRAVYVRKAYRTASYIVFQVTDRRAVRVLLLGGEATRVARQPAVHFRTSGNGDN